MRIEPRARVLSIYLLKAGVADPVRALAEGKDLDEFRVPIGAGIAGTLFVQRQKPGRPSWVSFFDAVAELKKLRLHTASTAAVLFLPRSRRVFAITFGHGRHLLEPWAYEENFGLRATLNAVDPDRLKTIDRDTFEGITRHTREQASKETDITAFGMNVEQDLLRAVTGVPNDEVLGTLLTGRDALNATVHVDIAALPALLDRYLEVSKRLTYRERFAWADHLRDVRDQRELEELDSAVVKRLEAGELDNVWLAAPDIMDWGAVAGFRYSTAKNAPVHDDLHIKTYLADRRKPEDVSIERLRADRVTCVSTDDTPMFSWPVYRCLYAEVENGDRTFLLSNGTWYAAERSFTRRINSDVRAIPTSGVRLPVYADKTEAAYNRRVASRHPKRFALLDKDLIRYAGTASAVEFCDIYTRDQQMIHVKRYGGSSVLSHLFAQGVVAGRLFLERDFRELVNQKLPGGLKLLRPKAPIRPPSFEIVFAIISRSAKATTLPFFSRVNLRAAYHNLRAYGYKVTISHIRNENG